MRLIPRTFPSRTLAWYLGKLFLIRSVAVLGSLLIILQTLDLLGESGQILAVPGNGQGALWHYVALRAPQIIAFALPFSMLLGTLITLVTLNQNSEVIAMKAGGVSAHQIIAPLMVVSLVVSTLFFVFNERVVTRATDALNAWQDADYRPVAPKRGSLSDIWVRESEDIVHARQVAGTGTAVRLTGVTIYDRNGNALTRIITAPYASFQSQTGGGEWLATDASVFDLRTGTSSPAGTFHFGRGIVPSQFTLSTVTADTRSLGELGTAIGELRRAGRPTTPLESAWWHKISGPLSSVLMPLLAGVAAFGLARSGALFIRSVIGMGLGFAYFVVDSFSVAMGNLGAYPPVLAAWAPFLLFLLIGETVLIRTEE